MAWAIIVGVAVLLFVAVIAIVIIYNRLVRRRLLVREGFSGIDVQLKRRHDLIPNLVKTVQGYADFEKEVLEDVTKLRGEAAGSQSMDERQTCENQLSSALKRLLVVVEAYPNLKADAQFLDFQRNLTQVEDHLQKARRYYNGAVRDYNIAVESFPSNVVAKIFGFPQESFFEVDTTSEREAPVVKFNQGSDK